MHSSFKSYFDGISNLFLYILKKNRNIEVETEMKNKKIKNIRNDDTFWKNDINIIYKPYGLIDENSSIYNSMQETAKLRNSNPLVHIVKDEIKLKKEYEDNIISLEKAIKSMINYLYNKKAIY